MLVDAAKMVAKRQGADPSRPIAQMSGSAIGNLFPNHLDKPLPRAAPRMPATTVTAPKM